MGDRIIDMAVRQIGGRALRLGLVRRIGADDGPLAGIHPADPHGMVS
ncbi:hypothetical protein [Nocardia sp. CNY236]|nr:hypothetical protein [Nocardia sp. CNY236]